MREITDLQACVGSGGEPFLDVVLAAVGGRAAAGGVKPYEEFECFGDVLFRITRGRLGRPSRSGDLPQSAQMMPGCELFRRGKLPRTSSNYSNDLPPNHL